MRSAPYNQTRSLWVQQWEGLPLGRSLARAVLPTHDHHVNKKEVNDKIVKTQGNFIRRELIWMIAVIFIKGFLSTPKSKFSTENIRLPSCNRGLFSFASSSCINVIKFYQSGRFFKLTFGKWINSSLHLPSIIK